MDNTSPFQPWASDDSSKNVKSERDVVDDAKLHRENVNHPKHRQTASYDKESVAVPSLTPGTSSAGGSGTDSTQSRESKMDSSKVASMQQIVENTLSQEGRQRVSQLLEAVEGLSGAERLLLYLRLPTGIPPHDPLKQPMNPLGSRAELQQTVIWIQTHLEVDPDVSLPKQDVYDEYIAHCMSCNTKPLSTADFGKVMKQVYPTVRPRRLGTRGNSRYCYAGLRKKIKLEVPQLPDLGESSSSLSTKEPIVASSRETERVVCDWAEAKLGVKFNNISELARHLMTGSVQHAIPSGPTSISPPPLPPASGLSEEQANRQLLSRLKRKMQVSVGLQPHDSELIQGTQGSPGRPKKNKGQELAGESPPSTSYVSHHPPLKHESENISGENIPGYGYQPTYVPMFDRPPFPPYTAPRAHPSHSPHGPHPSQAPHPPMHDYRQDPYAFESSYARDLSVSVPSDVGHNLPINLSSDASLDLSTERGEWQRRRPPEPPPPPPRLPLPGKKLILETYQSETRSVSPRSQPPEPRPPVQPQPEEFPRTEYLPKKMRAAEILGGKIAAARLAAAAGADTTPRPPLPAAGTAPPSEPSIRTEVAFLEDSKNLTSRSKSTAAALAREEQEAASLRRAARAPSRRRARPPPHSPQSQPEPEPDPCCGLGGINIKTGMICAEKHTEILNRERVISICNIDKHDLDDYLNEGSSQDHEEELVHYFHKAAPEAPPHSSPQPPPPPPPVDADPAVTFLETQDPQDEHSQGKNEKISQLRELLAKNLKNQSGSTSQTILESQGPKKTEEQAKTISEGAFKPLMSVNEGDMNGTPISLHNEVVNKHCNSNIPVMNGNSSVPYVNNNGSQLLSNVGTPHLYNGHCHNEPQSPTSRTQQYDFVPISDGCHSPGNFNSKSPVGFGARGQSPTKVNKQVIMGGSLQTSPISHSTAASPFVSPRNTPVPRSRFCSRPIPKLNGRKRRNPLSLGMSDPKQFAVPNDQKFTGKIPLGGPGKYCQPMSAPPSPNILCSQYKNQMYNCGTIPNGTNLCLNFLPNQPFRDHMNGDQPLSADPLSNEVSQFFQETVVTYSRHDAFRSQSVPLKHAMNNMTMLSYNNTPVGSVPPTPIPNEFCDFGSLADTCDITKAGLNRETLDKIYNAIDSNNDVLSAGAGQNLLSANDTLNNDCDPLPEQPLLSDHQLTSLIPTGDDLLDRSNQFNQSFTAEGTATDNVEDFLKRANSMEFELNDLVDKNKYYTSRSVPSTPLPYKRPAPNLQIDSRRSRQLFAADNNYSNMTNGISSKSVPSTPQFVDEKSFFGFSNRDFLINGNSVSGSSQIHETVVDNDQELTSPLHDMLREDILAEPLTPALLADLDKMDGAPYVDL